LLALANTQTGHGGAPTSRLQGITGTYILPNIATLDGQLHALNLTQHLSTKLAGGKKNNVRFSPA